MYENYAIIVAGGMGTRMGTDTPKQFLLLRGLPVMMHTISAFHRSNSSPHIVVVITPSLHSHWSALCSAHHFGVPHTIAYGGKSRFESVKSGLESIKSTGADLTQSFIAVHDAARPLISPELIDSTFRQAVLTGAAAPAIQSTDSVRLKSKNGSKNNAYPRGRVYLMQTPQTFNGAILSESYEQVDHPAYTDDASVVERKGHPVTLIEGDALNIKITIPRDLRVAEIHLETVRSRFE